MARRRLGIQKLDSLSKFFDSVLDGTADLSAANEAARQEEFVPDETELEIERKQEAQRIALAHGGFGSLIDFEQAILTHGKDYHGKQGYPGMMGGGAPAAPVAKKDEEASGQAEDPIHKILKHQQAQGASADVPHGKMAATGADGEFVAATPSGQPQTAAPPAAAAEETFVAAGAGEAPGDGARAKDEL